MLPRTKPDMTRRRGRRRSHARIWKIPSGSRIRASTADGCFTRPGCRSRQPGRSATKPIRMPNVNGVRSSKKVAVIESQRLPDRRDRSALRSGRHQSKAHVVSGELAPETGVICVSYEPLIRIATATASFQCRLTIQQGLSHLFWKGSILSQTTPGLGRSWEGEHAGCGD